MTRLLARLRAFWHRREIRRTLDEEIQFHVEMEADAHRARGLSPSAAARQAAIDLGGPSHVREAVLDVRTSRVRRFADSFSQDVRYGLRTFSRTPLAIGSVVLVLAVGIGLNSAVFGAIDAVFFRPLSVPRPNEMVYVTAPAGRLDFEIFQERARGSIEGLSPVWLAPDANLSSDDLHLRANGEWVSTDYFTVLHLKPEIGRLFQPADDDPAMTDRAVVVSDDLWRRRFGADPTVVGRQLHIDDMLTTSYTIVGVAPAGFRGVSLPWTPTEFWGIEPLPASPATRGRKTTSPVLIARLVPGASVSSLSAIVADHREQSAERTPTTEYEVKAAAGLLTPDAQISNLGFVRALADAVAVMALAVMLIAASNVVGILMARGVARSSELAVRRALGAGARRLAQQLLTESVLIGAVAGAAGLFVAWVLMRLYRVWSPYDVTIDLTVNAHVVIYTLVVCVGAGVVVGIAPARQALRLNILAGLGAPGAGITAVTRRGTRYGSVIPQMALSVGLLIVAGAHAFALARVEQRNPGYQIESIVTLNVSPPLRYYRMPITKDIADATNRRYIKEALENLSALPGVAAVARASMTPASFDTFPRRPYTVRGLGERDATFLATSAGALVSADFFAVFRIPLVAGRTFDDERDGPSAPPVAIVSSSFARQLAPGGAVIGRQITTDRTSKTGAEPQWSTIVGVVGDTLGNSDAIPMVYAPMSQFRSSAVPSTIFARVSVYAPSIAPVITRTLNALDGRAQVGEVLTMSETIARAHYVRRLALAMLAIAGLFGVVLAAIGLYSAVSYWVAQQARDLGVRATLGATRGDLVGLVIRDGLKTVLIALVPGIALGLVGFRLTAGLVRFVVGPIAAPALGVVAAVVAMVLLVALAACYLPGRRAAKADPLVARRS